MAVRYTIELLHCAVQHTKYIPEYGLEEDCDPTFCITS